MISWIRIESNWKQFVGAAKANWGKLTDDQLHVIAGRREWLSGSIQETYGVTPEAAQRQIDQWQRNQKGVQGDDERSERLAGPGDQGRRN